MSHYRKIDTRIWNDEKFNSLSNDGKLSFLFVLTHPNMTSLGAMRATIEGLASEIDVFREAFMEAFDKGMLKADTKAKLIHAPNFLKYNKPESPNVVRAWGKAYDMLPECESKELIYSMVKASVKDYGEGFAKAFKEAFTEEYG
jgi:hypothetical protein